MTVTMSALTAARPHVTNMRRRASHPTRKPIAAARTDHGAIVGSPRESSRTLSAPVTRPIHGPASMATRNVPIESRKIHSWRVLASWPPTTLMATATGISRMAMSVKSRLIDAMSELLRPARGRARGQPPALAPEGATGSRGTGPVRKQARRPVTGSRPVTDRRSATPSSPPSPRRRRTP
nr:hypothetical protein DA06_04225 [Georgenia sp. SUBG003]